MRSKEFLEEQGMPKGCRADTVYILGAIYDDVQKTKNFNVEKIESLREYLNQHRELIDNKEWPIVKTSTIITKYEEFFKFQKEKEAVMIQEENIDSLNFNKLIPNYSIRKVHRDWENKTGVYAIFIDNILVYIGSTAVSFKKRFQAHKEIVKNGSGENVQRIHKEIRIALNNNKKVDFQPIVIIEDLHYLYKRHINEKELKCMELALITTLKPIYNVAGVFAPFSFK